MKRILAAVVLASVVLATLSGCENVQAEKGITEVSEEVATWVCGKCGASSNIGEFCTECGEQKQSLNRWVCHQCGATSTGKFCTDCGSPRYTDVSSSNTETSTVTSQTESNSTQSEEKDESTTSSLSSTQNSSVDSGTISVSKGTIEDPSNLGEWFCVGDARNIEIRITGVIKGSEATQYIDDYNKQPSANKVTMPSESGIESCVLQYEVRCLSTEEMSEHGGLGRPLIKFFLCGTDGASVKKNNTRIVPTCTDISIIDEKQRHNSGDIFTDGRVAFYMYSDFSDYLIAVGYEKRVHYVSAK